MIVAYATQAGRTSADGADRNRCLLGGICGWFDDSSARRQDRRAVPCFELKW